MRINFWIVGIGFLLLECKRDPVIQSTDCADMTVINLGTDTTFNTPRFNPNNSSEIIYVKGIHSLNKSFLVKKNLLNGHEDTIVGGVWRRPDWNIKDWIIFNHADNQVWKVKSNGDSLILITTDLKGGHNAVWSADGNKIAFTRPIGSSHYNLVCDPAGSIIDTLSYFAFYLNRWSPDGKKLAARALDYANVIFEDVLTHQIIQPTNTIPDPKMTNMIGLDGLDWTPDSQYIVWCNPTGIYKTNVITKQTTKIRATCNDRYFTNLSIAPDGQRIIAQRIDVAGCLFLMDSNGKNETIIK